jgi:hypothetical protein
MFLARMKSIEIAADRGDLSGEGLLLEQKRRYTLYWTDTTDTDFSIGELPEHRIDSLRW